ncbi:MAG TPA: hypothetical protein ENN47_08410 [Mesotoga infera]|uniref:Permease n=1 Tax=Mesotoga infera TaxID=1236046 RepID=A0A7C1CWX0_9BACT|nr:hypothetical protein [Mesotoga infera]
MNKTFKRFLVPISIALVFVVLAFITPDTAKSAATISLDYFMEMVLILPPVFILMGLMEIWIPKDKIQKWLGNDSGIKGAALSIAMGTLPTGPLYVAFPLASSLLKKGASIVNVVLFLGSWAALKIPQLMVEVKFMGISFTILRFSLTLAVLTLIGLTIQLVMKKDAFVKGEVAKAND